VGPYEFTLEDARNTLRDSTEILDLMAEGRPGAIDHLRTHLVGVLGAIDPVRASDDEVANLLPAVWSVLAAAVPTLRAVGATPAPAEGRVTQINRGGGGVPKLPIDATWVNWGGLEHDVQASRKHHGRPYQALCIWSSEVIARLVSAGHSVFPGACGENITIAGLDWTDVRPGTRLRVGEVLCDVWAFATPCFQLKQWFLDGDFNTIHERRRGDGIGPRVYATVVERGDIRTGDIAAIV
jgi:MOSC domain-containing protein YiiM